MTDIVERILVLAPSATFGPGRSVLVRDDGAGPYLEAWNAEALGRQQPTIDELAAVTSEQIAAAQASRAAAAAKAEVATPAGPVPIAVTALGLVLNGALNEIRQRVNEIDARIGGTGLPLPITTADQGRVLIQAAIDALLAGG